jgi:hypothetical protein
MRWSSALVSIDPTAEILEALAQAEAYRDLIVKSRDRGEREVYEHVLELYIEIAEALETLLDR